MQNQKQRVGTEPVNATDLIGVRPLTLRQATTARS